MIINKYNAICKPNQLIYGSGSVVIVTGWTPKEKIAALLSEHEYAAIGNLYSCVGIDYLVRNLLANPWIIGLVMLRCTSQDKASGSMNALQAFFEDECRGKEDSFPRTLGDNVSIGTDISVDALLLLRNQLHWLPSPGVESLRGVINLITIFNQPWGRKEDILILSTDDLASGRLCSGDPERNTSQITSSGIGFGRKMSVPKNPLAGLISALNPRKKNAILAFKLRNTLLDPPGLAVSHAYPDQLILPFYFPIPEIKTTTYPGPLYGHRIEGQTIAETWVKVVQRIKTSGIIRSTGYDGKIQELIDLVAIVTDEPEDLYFPEPNYLPCDRAYIDGYVLQVLDDAPYTDGVKYTYGQRLRSWFGRDQVEDVIQKLLAEIDSASAVMSLWDSGGNFARRADGTSDHQHGGSPCLNHIWLRVVDGELSMTATFRSNDMFDAWVANAMGLRLLQSHILDRINQELDGQDSPLLKIGPLITISQSAHIYDHAWDYADKLIEEQYIKFNKPAYSDPIGNYLVEVVGDEIVVDRYSPNGSAIVCSYHGNEPLKLLRQIVADAPALQPDHAGYLGMELQQARQCMQQGIPYIQDSRGKITNASN